MSGSNSVSYTLQEIGKQEGFTVSKATSLAGGSINEVVLMSTSKGAMVVKINKASAFPGMFEAEKKGLEVLIDSGSFDVPSVISMGTINDNSYLLLDYRQEGQKKSGFWEEFAENLAALHRNSTEEFGFSSSNYIGSLPQYNEPRSSAADFYVSQRLEPQIRMAADRGFRFNGLDNILKNIAAEIPEEEPALVHGDLWSGNYLVNEKGLPCLIDPAVAYAHREMDLSMMKLFGGFPLQVFGSYTEIFPLSPGFQQRIPLWQLYYLLVHLNIFGQSYLPSVQDIFRKYL